MTTRILTASRPATPERWQAAARRAQSKSVTVRQLNSSGLWIATSGSRADMAYELEIVDGVARSCSCEAAAVWGDPVCCHRAAFYLQAGTLQLPAEPIPAAEGA